MSSVDSTDLRAELQGLKLSQLMKRAGACGLPEAAVEAAVDSEDPKGALVELVAARSAGSKAQSCGAGL